MNRKRIQRRFGRIVTVGVSLAMFGGCETTNYHHHDDGGYHRHGYHYGRGGDDGDHRHDHDKDHHDDHDKDDYHR
jgi:hypothetical protein